MSFSLPAIVLAGCVCPLTAFALFLPTIINQVPIAVANQAFVPVLTRIQLGYSATPANLLTVPVYVIACTATCAAGFYGDRKGRRGLIIT